MYHHDYKLSADSDRNHKFEIQNTAAEELQFVTPIRTNMWGGGWEVRALDFFGGKKERRKEQSKTETQSDINSWRLLMILCWASPPAGRQRYSCQFSSLVHEIRIHFRSLCFGTLSPCWKPITQQFHQFERPAAYFPHPTEAQRGRFLSRQTDRHEQPGIFGIY